MSDMPVNTVSSRATLDTFSLTVRDCGMMPNRFVRSWRSRVANATKTSLLMKL